MLTPPARRPWIWVLYATVAYTALISSDLRVGPAPVKLLLLAATMAVWLAQRRRHAERLGFSLGTPVLVVAVGLPVAWTLVAEIGRAAHFSAAAYSTHFTLQHASRFLYLLLFFPIADLVRSRPEEAGQRVWLSGVALVCVATGLLWLDHELFGNEFIGHSSGVGPFQGIIGTPQGAAFRVFIGNQILILPALCLMLGRVLAEGPSRGRMAAIGLMLLTLFVAHTRGLWTGAVAACIVIALLIVVPLPRSVFSWPRHAGVIAATGAGAIFALSVVWTTSGGLHLVGHDRSLASRSQQAPALVAAWKTHPVLGSGLGTALSSGYRRSPTEPWSFELTYVQTLFQMGVVGLALLMLALGNMVWRGVRAMPGLAAPGRVSVMAACGAMIGVIATSATNPYLFTGFGMLTVGVIAVMVEQAVSAGRDARAAAARAREAALASGPSARRPRARDAPERA